MKDLISRAKELELCRDVEAKDSKCLGELVEIARFCAKLWQPEVGKQRGCTAFKRRRVSDRRDRIALPSVTERI